MQICQQREKLFYLKKRAYGNVPEAGLTTFGGVAKVPFVLQLAPPVNPRIVLNPKKLWFIAFPDIETIKRNSIIKQYPFR